MNKKGFMMAEVVVVSAIVMTIIVGFYISYNKIYSIYRTRLTYYDTNTLYRLGYYRDILIENNVMNNLLDETGSIKLVYGSNNNNIENVFHLNEMELPAYISDTVYCIRLNNKSLDKKIVDEFSTKIVNPTFKDYIQYLSISTKFSSNYLMLMERCEINNDVKNNNDCKYAYLEIYDGNK